MSVVVYNNECPEIETLAKMLRMQLTKIQHLVRHLLFLDLLV